MAVEILRATSTQSPVQHQIHHDIESVVWVLAYSILRRCAVPPLSLAVTVQQLAALKGFFQSLFGHSTTESIVRARTGADPLLIENDSQGRVSNDLRLLCEELWLVMHNHGSFNSGKNPKYTPLTYELVLEPLKEAIESIKQAGIQY